MYGILFATRPEPGASLLDYEKRDYLVTLELFMVQSRLPAIRPFPHLSATPFLQPL